MGAWLRRAAIWGGAFVLGAAGPATAASDGLVQAAASLGAGQFAWPEEARAAGAVSVVVSIPLQQIFVYRNGSLIAASAVSTGRAGHETPTGEFTVLQKAVTHRSNRYDNAPMPFMERLTWDGVAIHAGHDPGHADSHGCVRVPLVFAKKLYAITGIGTRVSIVGEPTAPGLPLGYTRVKPTPPAPVGLPVESTDPEADATRAANLAAQPAPAAQ